VEGPPFLCESMSILSWRACLGQPRARTDVLNRHAKVKCTRVPLRLALVQRGVTWAWLLSQRKVAWKAHSWDPACDPISIIKPSTEQDVEACIGLLWGGVLLSMGDGGSGDGGTCVLALSSVANGLTSKASVASACRESTTFRHTWQN